MTVRPRWAVPLVALAVTNGLVLAGAGGPRAAIGLPVALILPGALALRALGVTRRGWEWLLHAVALSLAGLMAVSLPLGLVGGWALSPTGCLLGLDALILLLGAAAVRRQRAGNGAGRPGRAGRSAVAPRHAGGHGTSRQALGGYGVVSVLCGAVAVALAVLGARRLNAGGDPVLTEVALGGVVVALVAAALAARRGRIAAAAGGIYLAGLALLFATSLRGAGVTGHDVKIEYRVLADMLRYDQWRPGGVFSGYNSCLSLTVLPAFLSRLFGLAALDVFRVCFQVVFALVPVGTFVLARRLVPAGYAALAAALFVAFPTFVNDMPTLNRQEIALVFFTAAALTLLRVREAPRRRVVLLAILGAGVTVSHYTTTYVAVALLLVAWLVRLVSRRATGRFRATGPAPALVLPAAALCAMAIAWAVLAGSAPAFAGNLRGAAASVVSGEGVDSDATRYGLIAAGRPATDEEILVRYLAYLRDSGPPGEVARPAPGCASRVRPRDTLAPTSLGATLDRAGIAPGALNSHLRILAALLFQGGAVLGALLLWWALRRSRRSRPVPRALAEVSAAGLVLLAGMLVAPQLSDSYGLLRLYQQVLVFFAPLIVLAIRAPVTWLAGRGRPVARPVAWPVAMAVVVGCLLTTVGLVPQLTGGYAPQLNLNNAGPYYRAEYATGADMATMAWVRRSLAPHTWVVSDSRGTSNLRGMTGLFPQEGVAPGLVPPAAHLVLPDVDRDRATAVVVAGDRVLGYEFPVGCVTAGRELLFASGSSRVYGPAAQP